MEEDGRVGGRTGAEIQIKNLLLKFVENPVLRDATTPHGQAFEWILYTDVAQLDALNA